MFSSVAMPASITIRGLVFGERQEMISSSVPGSLNKTREQAIREITEYIEVFYNRLRRQKRLGYLSPVAYRKQFFVWKGAA